MHASGKFTRSERAAVVTGAACESLPSPHANHSRPAREEMTGVCRTEDGDQAASTQAGKVHWSRVVGNHRIAIVAGAYYLRD